MTDPIKHSPTPWGCNQSGLIAIIYDKDGNCIGHIQLSGHVVNAANAAHIVKCVNLHAELVEAFNLAHSVAVEVAAYSECHCDNVLAPDQNCAFCQANEVCRMVNQSDALKKATTL